MCAIRICVATSSPKQRNRPGPWRKQSPLRRALFFGAHTFLLECTDMDLIFWWHYQYARLLALFKRYDRAADELHIALRINPSDVRAISALAYLYGRLGRYQLAAEQFRKALTLDPDNAVLLFDLGYVCHLHKNYEPAIEAFESALRINPKIDRAWYGLGLALASLGRHEESAKALDRAATLQPMNPYAWFELGMAYHVLGRRAKLKEVIAHLDRFDPKMAQHLVRATESPATATPSAA